MTCTSYGPRVARCLTAAYDGDDWPDWAGGEPFHLERDITITVE